jgi:hypothetical protein
MPSQAGQVAVCGKVLQQDEKWYFGNKSGLR